MGALLAGLAAIVAGAGLATVTVVGVVQTQSEQNPAPVEETSELVPYGSNEG